MKCVLLVDNLKKVLSLVERSTGKDITLPILGSFLISTEGNTVKIMGTNLEVGIEASIHSTVHEQGKIAIPVKTFSSFISTLSKDEKVTLESKQNDLIVHTEKQKTVIKGYPPEDFPPFPIFKEIYALKVKKTDILSVLIKSIISTAKNTIKPELASLLFLLEKEIVTIASTDGFRLSEERIKPLAFSSKVAREQFLIPLRTCEDIIKLLEYGDQAEIDFHVGNGEILVQYSEVRIYSRLTEGKFPEYQQIIPRKFTTSLVVSRDVLLSHIRRASIFTNKLQGVTLKLDSNKGEFTVESNNNAVGEYEASFKSDIQGESLSIVFNYHYLLDGIDGYSQEESLFFGFNSESHPLVIKPVKKENSLYIVMPMKGV